MTNFVLDSYAWIEYLDATEEGEKVRIIVESKAHKILTSLVTISEVTSKLKRRGKDPSLALSLKGLSNIIELDEDTAYKAGLIHAEIKATIKDFGLADAIILAIARANNAKVLTGDPHFSKIKEAVML